MQLRYLTSNDWALLRSKSRRVTYKPREIIIAINSRPNSLFMVVSGTAAVEVVRGTPLAKLSTGEIFGEMAFIENAAASASVVAESEMVVDVLDLTVLGELFSNFPHLEARFFKSLALLLSQRLRSTLGRMSKTSVTTS
ncbi:MAG TPA: cyclic nucleotide-binding domain-containing protein [Candidatus Angelobacter sp.]|nr:cyclic nucleotide-binding domain-containing protein [Candidatus Angelobacter sp.]